MIRVKRYGTRKGRVLLTVRWLYAQQESGLSRCQRGLPQWGDVIGAYGTLIAAAKQNFQKAIRMERL